MSPPALPDQIPDLDDRSAEDVLAYMVQRFHPRLTVACSLQKEATVIIDMLAAIEPEARFFILDTGVLFPQTYDLWRRVQERYPIELRSYEGITLAEQARRHGDALWERDPDRCCYLRKVAPMERALADVDAWMSGLRRDQSPERAGTPKLEWDAGRGLWKANPLADWTDKDIWSYIFAHDVPYNPLHDEGYESIGCIHCTRPGVGREGRWAGRAKSECGIHQD